MLRIGRSPSLTGAPRTGMHRISYLHTGLRGRAPRTGRTATAPGEYPGGVTLRAGLGSRRPDAAALVEAIVQAEQQGLPAAWSTGGGAHQESVTVFAAAAARTSRIGFGTCVVPSFPRHPMVL